MSPINFPAPARWLPHDTPDLQRNIIDRALLDVCICETPLGSNRSGVIDSYNNAVGVPAGSYWCASAVSAWWREAGADVPGAQGSASCDTWMAWAKKSGRWSETPSYGAAVLYGTDADAHHIGVIVRLEPALFSLEGNTSIGGFDRNGIVVALKLVDTKRVVGYVTPTAAQP